MRRTRYSCALLAAMWFAGPLAASSVDITSNGKRIIMRQGRKHLPVFKYKYGDVPYKPYVEQLYSPAGTAVLRDAPHDHLHHHALMYAITVDGVNFWEEAKAPGLQKTVSVSSVSSKTVDSRITGGFEQKLDWINPRTGKVLLSEHRQISASCGLIPDATLLTWNTRLTTPSGKDKAALTGSHYHGLGMRFVESMDENGRFFNSAGAKGKVYRGSERLLRADWCAYTAQANGKTITIAMFDHPDNARHPAVWFVMDKPFSYMSATMNLHEEPFELRAGEPLALTYGAVLWDGETNPREIARGYEKWLKDADSTE